MSALYLKYKYQSKNGVSISFTLIVFQNDEKTWSQENYCNT